MNFRAAVVLSLILATPLIAQVEEASSARKTTTAPEGRRLRLISETITQNYLMKSLDGTATNLGNSLIYEDATNGRLGINTTTPTAGRLHIFGDPGSDVFIGLGPDPSGSAGTAFNMGYGGATFGVGVGFFNVRPDAQASAAAGNPSLRFLTGNLQRMIITNTGAIGMGLTHPNLPDANVRLHVFEDFNGGSVILMKNPNAGNNAVAGLRATSDVASVNMQSHSSTRALTRYGQPMSGWSELLHWQGSGLAIGTSNTTPMIFGTADTERMRILSNGNVGIGTTAPTSKLAVLQGSTVSSTNQNDSGVLGYVTQFTPTGLTNLGGMIGIRGESWQNGPGTATWATGGYFQIGNVGNGGTIANAYGVQAQILTQAGTIINGHGVYVGDVGAVNDYAFYQVSSTDTNYFAGNVVIGGPPTTANTHALYVFGDVKFDGTVSGTNIKANFQDVAEWVPASTDVTPGTVVVLNRTRNNEVMASMTSYDTTVAGVVSAQPGISLGIEGEGKEQIATSGRVKVRVDARTHPIQIGDLLVTSDLSGAAMRSEPMNLNGRLFHQPGTIIGKALEPLDGGVGEILVLLSLQ